MHSGDDDSDTLLKNLNFHPKEEMFTEPLADLMI
jgi:hypothetical protein